jgi:predicted dehydrogenase
MARVRIGVIGCGAIAQVQHIPNLLELNEEFEVPIVCDVAPGQAAYVARRFNIPRSVSDVRALLESDIDAVLLCHADPKAEIAVKAFQAGKHVLVEKPVCLSLEEVDAIVEAQERAGTIGQAAYMKAYDPAFEMAKLEIEGMDFKFIQVNHLHPSNLLHLDHFNVQHVGVLPPEVVQANRAALRQSFQRAFGPLCDRAEPVWGITYGLIHDLYSLRTMVGVPTGVKSVDIWKDNRAITVVLEYPNEARCVLSRVDLEALWDFRQTLEIYSDDKRVLLSYPTGFSQRVLSTLVVQGIDEQGTSYSKKPAIPWESAFTAELRHFHACITKGMLCRTPIAEVRHDVQLIIDITKSYIIGESMR